jgi:hypothetical protein
MQAGRIEEGMKGYESDAVRYFEFDDLLKSVQ